MDLTAFRKAFLLYGSSHNGGGNGLVTKDPGSISQGNHGLLFNVRPGRT